MQEFLTALVRDEISVPLGLCFAVAFAVTKVVGGRWRSALKNAGVDRDELIRTLELGGDLRRHYVHLIIAALNRVDRFLRDADKARESLPSPFGNRDAAPYWTGYSFDKCALIAVVYPIAALILTWVLTGDAGEIGTALGMNPAASLPGRLIAGVSMGCTFFAMAKSLRSGGVRSMIWLAVAGAFAFAGAFAGAFAFAFAFAVAFAVAVAVAGAFAGAFAFAFAFAVAFAVAVAVAGAFAGAFAFAVTVAVAVAVAGAGVAAGAVAVLWLTERAVRGGRLGTFWLIFWPVAVLACYTTLHAEASFRISTGVPVLLVMLALVPLVNVPLDWASVGFTRALLRRGCEDDAPSPLFLGLADFVIGLILLAVLAAALVLSLQLVDFVSGANLVDVRTRLIHLYATPGSPENWWIYFTLFSTLIPSALNLIIGMCSVATWCQSAVRRARLIETIRALPPDSGRAQFDASIALLTPVAVGSFTACLMVWGLWLLILHYAWYTLGAFLWLAVAFEWLLTTVAGL